MSFNITKQIDKELDNILNSINLNNTHFQIVSRVLEGLSLEDAARGKSRQLAQFLINDIAKTMWYESKIGRKIVEQKINKSKKGKTVHVYFLDYSLKYKVIISYWFKKAGFRKRGNYGTTDKTIVEMVSPKRALYKMIKEEGYPLSINKADKGEVSKIEMLIALSQIETKKDEWLLSKKKDAILANSNNNFFPNFCHYQANKNIMLWDVYLLMKQNIPHYLEEHGIIDPLSFAKYIKTRRYDMKCVKFKKLDFTLENISIWEIDSLADDPKNIKKIKNILKITKQEEGK